jgi:hypothetical protein
MTSDRFDPGASTAVREFDLSVNWYVQNARRCRRRHQVLEVTLLIVGASISVVALAVPKSSGLSTAILGAIVVVLGGLRQVFRWHENYVRFTHACQSLKAERRRYHVGQDPYGNTATRDKLLLEALNRVEGEETRGWTELMLDKSSQPPKPP